MNSCFFVVFLENICKIFYKKKERNRLNIFQDKRIYSNVMNVLSHGY